jgi:hypothetical protein
MKPPQEEDLDDDAEISEDSEVSESDEDEDTVSPCPPPPPCVIILISFSHLFLPLSNAGVNRKSKSPPILDQSVHQDRQPRHGGGGAVAAQTRSHRAHLRGNRGRCAGLRLRAFLPERGEPPRVAECVARREVRCRVLARRGAAQWSADVVEELPAHHLLPDQREGQGAGEAHQSQGEGGSARVCVCQRHTRAAVGHLGRAEVLPAEPERLLPALRHHGHRGRELCVLRVHPPVSAIRRATHAE